MDDNPEYQEEKPLDFSQPQFKASCPYCGETIDAEELEGCLDPESNTFI